MDLEETAHLKAKENLGPSSSSPSSTVSASSAGSSASVPTVNPELKGFPRPFPIPLKWSDSTSKAISSGKMIPLARKEITQTCVTLMMVYEPKPSRDQVAIELVRKYPQIADPIGAPHVSNTVSHRKCAPYFLALQRSLNEEGAYFRIWSLPQK